MTNQCNFKGCKNTVFTGQQECILHCEKGDLDNLKVLENFYAHILHYISDYIYSKYQKRHLVNQSKYISKYLEGKLSETDNIEEISNVILNEVIEFDGIVFPQSNNSNFDYLNVVNKLLKIHFHKCKFYQTDFNLNRKGKFLFKECIFYEDWYIDEIGFLDEITIFKGMYQKCTFHKEVRSQLIRSIVIPIKEDPNRNITLDYILFNNCQFNGNIAFYDCILKKMLFENKAHKTKIKNISLYNCTLDDKFILNDHTIDDFSCEDSVFKNKFEFKNNTIVNFVIDNCNFYKVVDFFQSSFIKSIVKKSIFEDFIGFEKCIFGLDGNNSDNTAIFKYVTFKSFTNFRNADFKNGFDIENINPKEPPNFLGIKTNSNGTNRETFRIIKHSFDKVGNYIEANKFFKLEMEKYQEELKLNKNRKEHFIFWINKLTSDFGQSYIRPFILLIVAVYAYWFFTGYGYEQNLLYEIHHGANYFINLIAEGLNVFAKNLIPFSKLLPDDKNLKFIGLVFNIIFSVLSYQIIIALKRLTKR